MLHFLRRNPILVILLVTLLLFLSSCQPLDTFGEVLTSFTNSLARMVESLVDSIRFPAFPSFR
jgi:hypothetical protein